MAKHPVIEYIHGVLDGSIPAGMLIRLAVERHQRDLETGSERGLHFDRQAAQHVIDFFGFLKHSKGEWAGKPFVLEPWQQFAIWVLFGWKRADGLRRFRTAYIEVPRKNGKSTLAAGIALYLLVADGESGAEIYSAATKRDQAKITWSEAVRMVQKSPALSRMVRHWRSSDNLSVEATASKFQPLGADADNMDGLNVHGVIIDELHAHKTRQVVEVLETATAARRQPLVFEITTAGSDQASICFEHHEYSQSVLETTVEDDTWFAFIACLDKDDDWIDPAVWCLSGDTQIYARISRGITVCNLQEMLESYARDVVELWDGTKWVKLLGYSESGRSNEGQLRIELRSGQRISCIAHHEWPTQRGKVRADELRIGDVITTTTLPGPDEPAAIGIPDAFGWLVGLYLAEGTRSIDKDGKHSRVQLHGHVKEMDTWSEKLTGLIRSFGGTSHQHKYGNRGILVIESSVVQAMLDLYIGGKTAAKKYLKPAVWRRSNEFLSQLIKGYLDGDGFWDAKNSRYRLGFTRNYRLAKGFRTIGARLGASVRIRTGFSNLNGKRYAIHRGEWRDNPSNHSNARQNTEILAIRRSNARRFFHIGVDNKDGLFALASGVLTHNSKANPNLGVSVKPDDLERKVRRAAKLPAQQNALRRLHFDEWTQQVDRWIDLSLWDENAGTVNEEDLRGRVCYGGLDLSSVSDVTAWVLAFPGANGPEELDILARFWVPEAKLHDDANKYAAQYRGWVEQGFLQTTPGDAVDYAFIKRVILEDAEKFQVENLNVDRLFQGYQLSQELVDEGLTVIGMGQGFLSMAVPMRELERRLLGKKLHHGGQPMLRWMAGNVAVRQDPAGNFKPDKASTQGKIDGIVALVMALDRVIRHGESGRSVYEERGVLVL